MISLSTISLAQARCGQGFRCQWHLGAKNEAQNAECQQLTQVFVNEELEKFYFEKPEQSL